MAAIIFRDRRSGSETKRRSAPRFLGMKAVLISAVGLALRRSTVSTMKAANGPASHRGSLAPLFGAFRKSGRTQPHPSRRLTGV